MAEARYMFCIHCEQKFMTNDFEICSLCGREGGVIEPDDPKAEALIAAAENGEYEDDEEEENEDEDEYDEDETTEQQTVVRHFDGSFSKAEALISVCYLLAWTSAVIAVILVLFTFGRTSNLPNTDFGSVLAAVIPGVLHGIVAFALLLALAEGLRIMIAIERNTRPLRDQDTDDEEQEDDMEDQERHEDDEEEDDEDEEEEGEDEEEEPAQNPEKDKKASREANA